MSVFERRQVKLAPRSLLNERLRVDGKNVVEMRLTPLPYIQRFEFNRVQKKRGATYMDQPIAPATHVAWSRSSGACWQRELFFSSHARLIAAASSQRHIE